VVSPDLLKERKRQSAGIEAQAPATVIPERRVDLVLIFSASAAEAIRRHGDSAYFLKRQLFFVLLGVGALVLGARTDYRWLRRYTYLLLLAALTMLAGVLVLGIEINGARRWFRFGPLTFQPVEIAKLALITYLAYSLGKKADKVKTFTVGFVPHLLVCAIMMVLLLKQPDLGSAVVLGATTLILLFVAGAKVSYLLLAMLSAAPVAYHLIVGTPWRYRRFLAYFNPDAYREAEAYQLIQSHIAVGSGGFTGQGLGGGRQALGYMPEGHSDFIMSSVGEELGFIGFALVLCLFGVIAWRGVRAALGSRDVFGTYVAFGITVALVFQALFNTGVVLGVLPNKGITLPFVSYGGSSLLVSMYLAGILLAVGRRPLPKPRAKRELVNVIVGARWRKSKVVVECGS
jgi:cell division protein FtsW